MNKKIITKYSILLTLIISGCSSITIKDNDKIRAIRVYENFPNIDKTGKLLGYDTFYTNIYYYRDQVLYNDFYHYGPLELYFEKFKNKNAAKPQIAQNFFVLTRGKTYGYFYDRNDTVFDKKVLADSMFKTEWWNMFQFKKIFLESRVSLLSQKQDVAKGTMEKLYAFRGIADTSFTGEWLLGFSNKMQGIEYSLSKEQDTLAGMKLCKVNVVNHSRYVKECKMTFDEIVQGFKIEEIPVTNPDKILFYFQRERKYNLEK